MALLKAYLHWLCAGGQKGAMNVLNIGTGVGKRIGALARGHGEEIVANRQDEERRVDGV